MIPVGKRAENHARLAKLYAAVRDAFPDAECDRLCGQEVMVAHNLKHDYILAGQDRMVACQRVEAGGIEAYVVSTLHKAPFTDCALEFLRQKHPEAYAGLIQWLVRG